MATHDAHQRCMMCRAIGFVIAAILVGLITWWLLGKVSVWLALLAFLGLFGLGLWLVVRFCGDPGPMVRDHGGQIGAGAAASAAVAGAAVAGAAASAQGDMVDADAQAARLKADAEAEAERARAEAEAERARAAAEAERAEKTREMEAERARAEAAAKAQAARTEVEAEVVAKAKADAEAAAKVKADAEAKAQAPVDESLERARAFADVRPNESDGSGSGVRPQGMDGPRAGGADDLKRIKGVGPKLEKLLNTLGFWHFDQIAAWGASEVAWVDDNLEGFKGRVSRDVWVDQAKLLAEGGETAFSKKVDKGDIY
jgi:predicted flap endonuclease-1-like 5' DNA nuclease